jgi:hypothetical protein
VPPRVRAVVIGTLIAGCTIALGVLGVLPLRGSESERAGVRRKIAIAALTVMVVLAGLWQAHEADVREDLRDRQEALRNREIGLLITKARVTCDEVARTYGDAAAVNVRCELGPSRTDGKGGAQGPLTDTPAAR